MGSYAAEGSRAMTDFFFYTNHATQTPMEVIAPLSQHCFSSEGFIFDGDY